MDMGYIFYRTVKHVEISSTIIFHEHWVEKIKIILKKFSKKLSYKRLLSFRFEFALVKRVRKLLNS